MIKMQKWGGAYKPGDYVTYVRNPEKTLVVGCAPYLFGGQWVVDCRNTKGAWVWGIYAVDALIAYEPPKKKRA